MLLALNLQIHHISWYAERNEYHEVVDAYNALSLCGDVLNRYIFKYR